MFMKLVKFCSLAAVVLFIVSCGGKEVERVGFVRIHKLFADFDGKKELEKELLTLKDKQQFVLDSLLLEVKTSSLEGVELEQKKMILQQVSIEFENNLSKQATQSDEHIWKQINQYVEEYGKENKYTFLYGAGGNGAIMYGDSTKDVTQKVLVYINNKYKGY